MLQTITENQFNKLERSRRIYIKTTARASRDTINKQRPISGDDVMCSAFIRY